MFKFTGFTEKANKALNKAVECAQNLGHTYIGSEHLLLGLLSDTATVAGVVLSGRKFYFDDVEEYIKQTVGVGVPTKLGAQDFTPRSKRIIENAVYLAGRTGNSLAGTEHILLSIASDDSCYAYQILVRGGVTADSIMSDISKKLMNTSSTNANDDGKSGSGNETLDQFSRDLTELARQGKIDPVIGRHDEIERVIQILSRRTKNNPCLIGEPGVGKTAIAEGLALKIVSGEVPETLKNKKIVSLDLTSMVAGTKYRGDFEERIKKVIDEVKASPDIILFIDEVHTLIGTGNAEGAVDAANILKPSLARGELQVIGATTIEEYRKNIEKDAALERRFQPVMVDEPSKEEAIEILKGLRDKYEAHHKVKITDSAIKEAVELSVRYIADRYLPDKAIDLIDEAASMVKTQLDTVPEDLDNLQRKELQLKIEEKALAKESDDKIARKIAQIQQRKERHAKRQAEKKENQEKAAAALRNAQNKTQADSKRDIQIGDTVRIKGLTTIGKVENITGDTATAVFGGMRTKMRLNRLEHATTPVENADKTEERKENLASYGISKETRKTIDSHKSNFHQDLDVRGMRGDEALNAVQYFIDDAILVGMPRVRILHGKGNGILRQLIRQYLSSVPNVTHYADEHVQFGGSGITVVDF